MKTLSNKIYDWAKVIGQLILPAIMSFANDVCGALNMDAETFVKIFASFIVLYNVFITAWNKVYHDQQIEEQTNDYDVSDPNEGLG